MEPIFALRLLLRSWLLPPAGLLVLALAGLVLARRRPRLGLGLAFAGTGLLLVLALPLTADALSAFVTRHAPLDPQRPVAAGAIVILAGGTRASAVTPGRREPSARTLERIAQGARLARATGLPVLVSGGVVVAGEPEALAMSRVLAWDFGVTPRWVETRSRTTAENAIESARLLSAEEIDRVVLVTTGTHMWRAGEEFAAAGLEVVAAPVAVVRFRYAGFADWLPSGGALEQSTAAIHELAGLVVARLGR